MELASFLVGLILGGLVVFPFTYIATGYLVFRIVGCDVLRKLKCVVKEELNISLHMAFEWLIEEYFYKNQRHDGWAKILVDISKTGFGLFTPINDDAEVINTWVIANATLEQQAGLLHSVICSFPKMKNSGKNTWPFRLKSILQNPGFLKFNFSDVERATVLNMISELNVNDVAVVLEDIAELSK